MNEYEKTPLVDLIKRMSELDTEIGMLELEYNKINSEIIRRFPLLKDDVNLQPKVLRKEEKK